MCGIAGIFSPKQKLGETSKTDIRKMILELRHRGPDDSGVWWEDDGTLILGHSRLAIVDLSKDGHQPMISSSGRYAICLNGEIYNYVELRKSLETKGICFRGKSDTEVLLESISVWGLRKALDLSIGMFALALWDRQDKSLVLTRGRVGKKPLYYLKRGNRVYFASEMKALRQIHNISLQIDDQSIYHYLTFGYIPSPSTIYKSVIEVPAGHYIIFDENLREKPEKYWQLKWEKKNISFLDAVSEADQLLSDAVKIRLRADVPVGCFLSGGIDSGLIAAIASGMIDKPLKTFTVSFQEGQFDEGPLAELVAKKYETEHHQIRLPEKLYDFIPKVINAYDEPFADPSAIPSYCVACQASKYVKVVLNGEGADELFGGYRRHVAIHRYCRWESVLKNIPEHFISFLQKTLPQPSSFRSVYSFAHRFIRGMGDNPFSRYIAWCIDGFTEQEKKALYQEGRTGNLESSIALLESNFPSLRDMHPMDNFVAMDFLLHMHDNMLVKMDIATMAHSLEGRNPFLDHRLIEWSFSLPHDIKMRGNNTKPLLRKLAEKYLPPQVVQAPKRGFEVPLVSWMRKELHEIVYDTCLSRRGIISEIFSRKYIEDLLNEKRKMDVNRWSKLVWKLFVLGVWEEKLK